MNCDRCNTEWQTRPHTQFPNGCTTLAICRMLFGNEYFTYRLCNHCHDHYKHAIVSVVGYMDDDEDDEEEEEEDVDEDPTNE